MSSEQFNHEKNYQVTVYIARLMLRDKIINEEEFLRIESIMLEKYKPLLGTLFHKTLAIQGV